MRLVFAFVSCRSRFGKLEKDLPNQVRTKKYRPCIFVQRQCFLFFRMMHTAALAISSYKLEMT
jgi:hypothetical protein